MSLRPGTRLGPYEIGSAIGAGGMGEVYRATDSHLKRSVAIKVLPAAVAGDADRLARFQREAEVLAALNHPNIAAIYGIVDLQPEGGSHTRALVMELVEGDDLSALIARGPVALPDALPIAKQIADALEVAHEQGIVHRDLKPANIKVKADGTVKVLDFGLAKAMDSAGVLSSAEGMNSPTFTVHATQLGVILGTAAYMAPEQARGKVVDKRADIWAFGVVVYEMLTGQRAFKGDDISETLASVLKDTPSLDALPATTPLALRRLVGRCLQRDVKLRLRDIGEARIALESGIDSEPVASRRPASRRPLVPAMAAVTVAALIVAGFAVWTRPAAVQPPAVRFTIPLPSGEEITSYPAITRDGRTVAYVAERGASDARLYLRDLNAFEPREVPGSSGARQPFFSPDGKWIAFFAQGQLLKAEVSGGTPVRVTEAAYPFGGTWNDDDTIVYAASLGSGLQRVRASGGNPEQLTKPDGAAQGYAHVFPQALPGGRSLLFTMWGQTQGGKVLSLDSGQSDLVLPAQSFNAATFQSTGGSRGRLLISDPSAAVRAAPFDAAHPARTSADTSVLADVNFEVETESRSWLAVSASGTAVYAPGNPAHASLAWVDRAGGVTPVGAGQDLYREAILSPDGLKTAVRLGLDIWIHDLQRGTRSRLTSGTGSNILPVWSRDGERIVFASNRGGDWDIYAQPADTARPAELLLKRARDQFPLAVMADGTLLYTEIDPKNGRDLWTLSPDGRPSPLRVTPANETNGQFSPGPEGGPRWLAYSSDETGRNEIYVQSYPSGANRIPVSTSGGMLPMWSPDGKELFYVTGEALVAVPMRPDGSFGEPRRLFDRSTMLLDHRFHSYAVSPDGKRFLMIRRDPASVPRQLNVILNWTDGSIRP
jgi:Tol biopolymer transport system component